MLFTNLNLYLVYVPSFSIVSQTTLALSNEFTSSLTLSTLTSFASNINGFSFKPFPETGVTIVVSIISFICSGISTFISSSNSGSFSIGIIIFPQGLPPAQ